MFLSRCVSTPITEIAMWEHFLFVGEGNRLRAFDISDKQLKAEVSSFAFESNNVHIIKPVPLTVTDTGQKSVQLFVAGGCCFRVLNFDDTHLTIRPVSPVVKLQDWIWDVVWLNDMKAVAILTAQNYVVLWDNERLQQVQVKRCQENCILYSGIVVGNRWSNLVVLSGTVFSEVLIWHPTSGDVWHRLEGHTGVIFSVKYNARACKLCTASDDRSIQIWKHQHSKLDSDEHLTASQWRESTFVLLWQLYGHEARIWKALPLERSIISVGEDSLLCIWACDDNNKVCRLQKKMVAHSGSSIWSAATDGTESLLATGSGNGSIKLWDIDRYCGAKWSAVVDVGLTELLSGPQGTEYKRSSSISDYPRVISFLDYSNLLMMTNEGFFCNYCYTSKQVTVISAEQRFESYSTLDVNHHHLEPCVAIGDRHGGVIVLRTEKCRNNYKFFVVVNWRPYDSKVLKLKWLDCSKLLINGPQGRLDVFQIEMNGKNVMEPKLTNTFTLPLSKQRWLTDAAVGLGGILICGTRCGSLYLYQMDKVGNDQLTSPVQHMHKIHGTHGVTHIKVSGDTVKTVGRDGFIRMFTLRNDALQLLYHMKMFGHSKWIAGMIAEPHNFVYGFHANNFVVSSEENDTVLWEVVCGGGHRAWDFSVQDDRAAFAYVKDRAVSIHTTTSIKECSAKTIKQGIHTSEICDVHHLFTIEGSPYFVTASEDTTIKILSLKPPDVSAFHVVHTLKSHISSVRTIASCPLKSSHKMVSTEDRLMVTCGGRAQMVLWKIKAKLNPAGHGIQVRQVMSHMLFLDGRRSRKPWLKQEYIQDPETRYMDSAIWPVTYHGHANDTFYMIAIACSDSFLRLFGLNIKERSVRMLLEDPYHNHCLLKVVRFLTCDGRNSILVTTATDGKVVLWDATPTERAFQQMEQSATTGSESDGEEDIDVEETNERCVVIRELRLHQSGITALSVWTQRSTDCTENETTTVTLATGGDDTDLKVTVLQLQYSKESPAITNCVTVTVTVAHLAQITGIVILSDKQLLSVSGDRRMRLWRLHRKDDNDSHCSKLSVDSTGYTFSSISDISSVACLETTEETYRIAVAGMGLEVIDLTKQNS